MDVNAIEPGLDFAETIESAVANCDVLIALIGNAWAATIDDSGRRRLDDPDDLVTREIRAALDRNIRVIPVLVDGASPPEPADLPETLASFARRNATRPGPPSSVATSGAR